jgi:GNAT superfamily N-acetyltransferase
MPPTATLIREYRAEDVRQVEECLVELMDFCKQIDALSANGRTAAHKYLEHLLAQCAETDGRIFVAEHDNKVIGMVCVFGKIASNAVDEEAYTYAYVSDLVVLAAHRHLGLGRVLLRRAEEHARSQGARHLKIGVHAPNKLARDLYISDGFKERIVILHKELLT